MNFANRIYSYWNERLQTCNSFRITFTHSTPLKSCKMTLVSKAQPKEEVENMDGFKKAFREYFQSLHCFWFFLYFSMERVKWHHRADTTETRTSQFLVACGIKTQLLYFVCKALHNVAVPICDNTPFSSLTAPNRPLCNSGKPGLVPPQSPCSWSSCAWSAFPQSLTRVTPSLHKCHHLMSPPHRGLHWSPWGSLPSAPATLWKYLAF